MQICRYLVVGDLVRGYEQDKTNMDAIINGDERYVVFLNNGVTVNSAPSPAPLVIVCLQSAALGRVVTSCVGLHGIDVGQP